MCIDQQSLISRVLYFMFFKGFLLTFSWNYYFSIHLIFFLKVSEYDQEISQSHTADQPTSSWERATWHLQ